MINNGYARFNFVLVLALGSLLLGGCAKMGVTTLKHYPPRAGDYPIEVITSAPSDKKYEEIALLDAKGGQHIFADRSTSGVIEQLKAEARKVGADAIIVRSTERGTYNWGQGGFDRARADAVAIRYLP